MRQRLDSCGQRNAAPSVAEEQFRPKESRLAAFMEDFLRLSVVSTFSRIARKHRERVHDLLSDLPQFTGVDRADSAEFDAYLYRTGDLRAAIADASVITIVFAATAAESYIYDFAARNLGDSFVEKYLDKLSTQSKWVIVPRLVAGYALDSDGQAYEGLIHLVRSRNEIVHHKSKNVIDMSPSQLQEYVYQDEPLNEPADKAITALDLLLTEAKKFDTPQVAEALLGEVNG